MKTITHEGKEYILKEDVEGIVSSRLSKTSEARRAAEARIADMETKFKSQQEKLSSVETLTHQLTMLQGDLKAARAQYSQHSTITNHGITNANIRDAVLWSYQEQMQGMAKKDQVDLNTWLTLIKTDPTKAPPILAPHLQTLQPKPAQPPNTERAQLQTLQASTQASTQPAQPPPPSNAGVSPQPTPYTTSDLLTKAADPAFYHAPGNRELIKEAYYKAKGKRPGFNW